MWPRFRFPLSFRELEELMLECGVSVSYETVRRKCPKFGQAYANTGTGPLIWNAARRRAGEGGHRVRMSLTESPMLARQLV